jgi:uncharacterized membrane protein YkoI
MSRTIRISAFFAMTLGLVLCLPALVDSQEGKGKGKGKTKSPDIVEIDLNKLPPELAQSLRNQIKPKTSSISLAEAIKKVEKTGKGEVERAARRVKNGVATFQVDVNTGERHPLRFTLNAQGKILDSKVFKD